MGAEPPRPPWLVIQNAADQVLHDMSTGNGRLSHNIHVNRDNPAQMEEFHRRLEGILASTGTDLFRGQFVGLEEAINATLQVHTLSYSVQLFRIVRCVVLRLYQRLSLSSEEYYVGCCGRMSKVLTNHRGIGCCVCPNYREQRGIRFFEVEGVCPELSKLLELRTDF